MRVLFQRVQGTHCEVRRGLCPGAIDSQRRASDAVECKMTKQLLRRCTAEEPALRPALEGDVLPALRQLAGRAKSRSITAAAATSCDAPAMLLCPITQV